MSAGDTDADVEAVLGDRKWPVRIDLKHPVEMGSTRVESLEFRRGKLGDLKGMKLEPEPPLDKLMLVASRMCGQPLAIIERLADEDGSEVLSLALGFYVRSLPGGRTR